MIIDQLCIVYTTFTLLRDPAVTSFCQVTVSVVTISCPNQVNHLPIFLYTHVGTEVPYKCGVYRQFIVIIL